jgi:hypothetical protein
MRTHIRILPDHGQTESGGAMSDPIDDNWSRPFVEIAERLIGRTPTVQHTIDNLTAVVGASGGLPSLLTS